MSNEFRLSRQYQLIKRPTILVNHLLEPPNIISGITRYLFSLLPELVQQDRFHYVLATTWTKKKVPDRLKCEGLTIVTHPFLASTPLNAVWQAHVISDLMQRFSALVELNCNPIGCFLPFWPRVVTVHDLYFRTLPALYPRHHRLWWNVLFPATARASSSLICVSHTTKRDLIKYYPKLANKAVVVHEASALTGVSGARLTTSLRIPKRYALMVGNISPNKNVELLAQGLKLLENQGTRLAVCHVGRDDGGHLARAVQKYSLGLTITSLGSLTDQELAEVYSGARCLVSTSKNEGFCLPVLEAQERGIPVLCPDMPIYREVAGDGALFFRPDEPVELANGLTTLFNDPTLHLRIAQSALANAARFSWSRAAKETEAVLYRASVR